MSIKHWNLFLLSLSGLSMIQLNHAMAAAEMTVAPGRALAPAVTAGLVVASPRELSLAAGLKPMPVSPSIIASERVPHRSVSNLSSDQLRAAAVVAANAEQGRAALPDELSSGIVSGSSGARRRTPPSSPGKLGSAFRAVGGEGALERLDLAQLDFREPAQVQKLQERFDQICAVVEAQRIVLADQASYHQRATDRLGQKVDELGVYDLQHKRRLDAAVQQLDILKRAVYATDPAVRDLTRQFTALERQVTCLADNLSGFAERLGYEPVSVVKLNGAAAKFNDQPHAVAEADESSVLPLLSTVTPTTRAVKSALGRSTAADASAAVPAFAKSNHTAGAAIAVAATVPERVAEPVVSVAPARWTGLSHTTQWALVGVVAAGVAYAKRSDRCVIS